MFFYAQQSFADWCPAVGACMTDTNPNSPVFQHQQQMEEQQQRQQQESYPYPQQQTVPQYVPPPPDYYMGYAMHPSTTAVWVVMGRATSNDAENAVRDACAKVMGAGCVTSWASNDSYIVFVQDLRNVVFRGWGANLAAAKDSAMTSCQKSSEQVDLDCRISEVFQNVNSRQSTFPSERLPRIAWAGMAWPKSVANDSPWYRSRWLVTGIREGYEAAMKAAIAQCVKETSRECEGEALGGVGDNGLVARYVGDGFIHWFGVSSLGDARRIETLNSSKGLRLVDTFSISAPGVQKVSNTLSNAPMRGFFAIARPSDDKAEKAWGKRALVTGKASQEQANAAAIRLCEAKSKLPCKFTRQDEGTEQFIILYRDDQGVQGPVGWSADAVWKYKEKDCADRHQQCTAGAIVDLAKPDEIVVTP
jgi:hypothetical protein